MSHGSDCKPNAQDPPLERSARSASHGQLLEGNWSDVAPAAFHRRRRNDWLGDWRLRTGCTRSSRTEAYPRTARMPGTPVWPAQLTNPRTLGRSGSQVGFQSHSGDTAPYKGTVPPGLRQVAFWVATGPSAFRSENLEFGITNAAARRAARTSPQNQSRELGRTRGSRPHAARLPRR